MHAAHKADSRRETTSCQGSTLKREPLSPSGNFDSPTAAPTRASPPPTSTRNSTPFSRTCPFSSRTPRLPMECFCQR